MKLFSILLFAMVLIGAVKANHHGDDADKGDAGKTTVHPSEYYYDDYYHDDEYYNDEGYYYDGCQYYYDDEEYYMDEDHHRDH